MEDIEMWEIFTPTVLISIAASCFFIGYLIVHQMQLRLLMLCGSVFYIGYYATAAPEPLYGGIYSTLGMMAANAVGMAVLMARRFRISLPAAHRDIYDQFSILNPGDFRLVMRFAERLKTEHDLRLTTEGQANTSLYFVIRGESHVTKRGTRFTLPQGVFVGEVSYLLNRTSMATTDLAAKAEILRWDIAQMQSLSAKNPRFKLAIDAMLSRDLAHKVAEAFAHPDLAASRPA